MNQRNRYTGITDLLPLSMQLTSVQIAYTVQFVYLNFLYFNIYFYFFHLHL